jgi:riboflavin kinase/FMN adenylyltransferase
MMALIRDLEQLTGRASGGAVSIGNFDGVHLGHAHLVEQVIRCARQLQRPSVILTFDPHPMCLLRPEAAPTPLTTTERKAELLAALGVDVVVAYPTDRELLDLEPETFFHRIVCSKLQARALVEGANFRFGRNRRGDVHLLAELCRARGIALHVVQPVEAGGEWVSSSRIRQLIAQGDVATANRLLTRPYRVRGLVVSGSGRGCSLGFPTANLSSIPTLLPAAGVYAGAGYTEQGSFAAAIHIGPSPTFDERVLKVEVHLVGFHGQLNGQWLEVEFFSRLRDIRRFGSATELQAQLAHDVAATCAIFEGVVGQS